MQWWWEVCRAACVRKSESHPVRDPLKSPEQNVRQIRPDLTYIILYWNSSACARAARNLHATNLPVLVCVFSVNFQNSEFRICIPLYMCIFSRFSETCYLIFWCMFLKIDWKYTYKGGMLILNSEFWTLTENTDILAGAHCMNLQIHQFSDQ